MAIQWHHFILHFINQDLADLPVIHANSDVPAPEAVVEGRYLYLRVGASFIPTSSVCTK